MKVLIIIPAYNEELNIVNTISRLNRFRKKSKYKCDYLIINDGSKDDTEQVCIDNNYNYISLVMNLGIGGAVQTGYKYAYYNNYDIAIQFDGDGQHDEKYIDNLIDEIEKGNDMVIGSRFVAKLSKFTSTSSRRLGIKILHYLIKLVTKKHIYDPTSGYRAINKRIIQTFSTNYPLEYPEPESVVHILNKKMNVKEIPVEMYERKNGVSSIKLFSSIYYMFSVCLAIIIISINKERL